MKINMPVGCVVLIKDTTTLYKTLHNTELVFNKIVSKLDKTEYTSAALTDIDDEGNLCIVETCGNGINKTKYEDWSNKNKTIEIFNLNLSHSKEKLYLLLDELQTKRTSNWEKWKFYYKYLLQRLFDSLADDEVPNSYTGQLPGYVWSRITDSFPFWRNHTPKSLKILLPLTGELLFSGNSKEL